MQPEMNPYYYYHHRYPSYYRWCMFSEASTDSGLMRSSGSPEYFNPPLEEYLSWEVEIPTHVGGKIIGKAGRNVKELRDKTGCKVIIKDIENSRRKQLLVVRGKRFLEQKHHIHILNIGAKTSFRCLYFFLICF